MMTLDFNPRIATASTDTSSDRRLRSIEGVYASPGFHWVGDGFRVAGYFGAIPDAVKKLSPFLLLDYGPAHEFEPTYRRRGVGTHPHRGFETVTLAFQGSVEHKDSTGGGGIIGPGDVQWMTAASGILHQEFHTEEFARTGGPFQMAQLWVNLPKAHKMSEPHYQPIEAKDIREVVLEDGASKVRIVAGEFRGERGPAKTFTPIDLFQIVLRAKGHVEIPIPTRHNVGLLVMKGDVRVNGANAKLHDFVVFEHDGELIDIEASRDAEILFLSGEPIDEPVVQYGPFVMNSPQEIREAILDFERGAFGSMEDLV